jgi:hypothetical protein
MGSCSELQLFEVDLVQASPALGPLIDLLNPPLWSSIKSSYCPTGTL